MNFWAWFCIGCIWGAVLAVIVYHQFFCEVCRWGRERGL